MAIRYRKGSSQIYHWAANAAPMERQERIDLSEDLALRLYAQPRVFGLDLAAAMLAAFGLIQDSAAVIIGAMLIAPLMTPIIGAGLPLAQGNRPLFALRSVRLSWVSSALDREHALRVAIPRSNHDIRNACQMQSLADRLLCRPWGDLQQPTPEPAGTCQQLAGAAIAAALVPPISTAGLQLHSTLGRGMFNRSEYPFSGPSIGTGECIDDHGRIRFCSLGTWHAPIEHSRFKIVDGKNCRLSSAQSLC